MDSSDVQVALNKLWASIVEEYHFDVLNHTIRFKTKVVDSGNVNEYDVQFCQVASFYFVDGLDEDRHNCIEPDEGDYVELTSVHFLNEGIGDIRVVPNGDWTNQYSSTPNFAIEMWSKMLFIEAASVKFNQEIFNVGYPAGI
nr:hypothetical protein [Bacilli bacterium]